MVKFGNVAGEHVKRAISVVQPQLSAAKRNPSAEQHNRVGALVTHHPAWMSHHTGGSRQGRPRYTCAQQWEGRGWPDQESSQSAAHRHTKCKSCLTGEISNMWHNVLKIDCDIRHINSTTTNITFNSSALLATYSGARNLRVRAVLLSLRKKRVCVHATCAVFVLPHLVHALSCWQRDHTNGAWWITVQLREICFVFVC